MFEIHLSFFEKPGLMGFRFPLWPKLAALVLAIVLGFASFGFGDAPPLGIILFGLTLIAGLYREEWRFSVETRTISFSLGIAVAMKTRTWSPEQIAGIELGSFIKGSAGGNEDIRGYRRFRKRYSTLSLIFADGERKTIETANFRFHEELARSGKRIAEVSGIRYTEA